jgi:hypothetical protein
MVTYSKSLLESYTLAIPDQILLGRASAVYRIAIMLNKDLL